MDESGKPISVMDAIEAALDRTKRMLFRPFDIGKWVTLGFCAFLATLGQGGGGYSGGNPFGGSGRDDFDKVVPWVSEHLTLVLTVGGAVLLVALGLGILMTWLSSRGEFMFLDGVVRDKAGVEEPWRRFRRLGNSLFVFRVVLGLAGFGAVLLIAGAGLLLAWPSIQARTFDTRAIGAIAGGACLFVPVVLFLALLKVLLRDFVVPIMYKRDLPAMEAFRVFRREILPGRVLPLILFYLLAMAIGLAAAVLILLVTCMTCCIAALPYISSVVFLPVLVFFRCYSLYFLEQVGEGWRIIERPEGGQPPPPPAVVTPGDSPSPPPSPDRPEEEALSQEAPAVSDSNLAGGAIPPAVSDELQPLPQPEPGDGAPSGEPPHPPDPFGT